MQSTKNLQNIITNISSSNSVIDADHYNLLHTNIVPFYSMYNTGPMNIQYVSLLDALYLVSRLVICSILDSRLEVNFELNKNSM